MYIKEYFTNYDLKDIFPEAYPFNQIYTVTEDDDIPVSEKQTYTSVVDIFNRKKYDEVSDKGINLLTDKTLSVDQRQSLPSVLAQSKNESMQISLADSEKVEIYGNKIKPLTEIDYSLVSKDNKKESILGKIDSKKLFFGAVILYILMR